MFIVSARNSRNMNAFTIRTATDNDAENIEHIICEWARTGKRRERAESIREAVERDGHQIIVAELEGRIIGVLHLTVYPDVMLGGQNSHVVFLLVDKDHSRKGVGSKLLEKAVETAREKGASGIHVDTIYPDAEQFYRERGFKDDGVMLERAL
jgi:predicted N-acetyltransferase YhbS